MTQRRTRGSMPARNRVVRVGAPGRIEPGSEVIDIDTSIAARSEVSDRLHDHLEGHVAATGYQQGGAI